MDMPEPGRLSAHAILDAVSVFRPEDGNTNLPDSALQRLNEIQPVTVTMTDDGYLDVRIDDLVGGALVLVQALVAALADCRQVAQEQIIAEVREFIDS